MVYRYFRYSLGNSSICFLQWEWLIILAVDTGEQLGQQISAAGVKAGRFLELELDQNHNVAHDTAQHLQNSDC